MTAPNKVVKACVYNREPVTPVGFVATDTEGYYVGTIANLSSTPIEVHMGVSGNNLRFMLGDHSSITIKNIHITKIALRTNEGTGLVNITLVGFDVPMGEPSLEFDTLPTPAYTPTSMHQYYRSYAELDPGEERILTFYDIYGWDAGEGGWGSAVEPGVVRGKGRLKLMPILIEYGGSTPPSNWSWLVNVLFNIDVDGNYPRFLPFSRNRLQSALWQSVYTLAETVGLFEDDDTGYFFLWLPDPSCSEIVCYEFNQYDTFFLVLQNIPFKSSFAVHAYNAGTETIALEWSQFYEIDNFSPSLREIGTSYSR